MEEKKRNLLIEKEKRHKWSICKTLNQNNHFFDFESKWQTPMNEREHSLLPSLPIFFNY